MTRRSLLAANFAALASKAPAQVLPKSPNILLIMADQMVPHLTGAYGHPVVKTPNLDALVKRGVRFDAAYSPNPVCAPARASLVTGRYSSRIGVNDNASLLPADVPTFAHSLELAGYDTAISGKMHFVGPDQHHGFRRRLSRDIYPSDFTWTKPRDKKTPGNHAADYVAEGVHVGRRDSSRGKGADGRDRWGNFELDEEAHTQALKYLRARARRAAEPFFLCASYNYPHEPFWPPKDVWELYEGSRIEIPEYPPDLEKKWSAMDLWLNRHHGVDQTALRRPESLRRLYQAYYALVTFADRKVGELIEALRRNGQLEKTVIIFTSDHGDMLGQRGMVQKRAFYEWSARVPLIVALPDGRWAGKTVATPVTLADVAPTILEAVGLAPQGWPSMDGSSLFQFAANEQPERTVFSESHSEGVHATCFMARRGRFKYVHIHGHESQLFDLESDPGEWINLAGRQEYRTVEQQLRTAVLRQFDPDRIEKALRRSIADREIIRDAMKQSKSSWDYRTDPVQ